MAESGYDPRRRRVLVVVGTRPEAIKMAPLVVQLKEQPWADVRVVATAQHRQMLDQVLEAFSIVPDLDLDIMRPNQTLSALMARLLPPLDSALETEAPDAVLVQGDTTTVLAMALAAFHRRIPVGHVEAGLRTGDMENPFPEEMNRVLAGRLARWHFAPTATSRDNLLREGVDGTAVHVTGNTVIDALLQVADRDLPLPVPLQPDRHLVLVTAHRRENFGTPFLEICRAIRDLADQRDDIQVVYPVHPNPNIQGPAREVLGGHARITLCDPLDYLGFVAMMKRAHLIVTDSGGVQEEAPALGKPVLVLRNETERPEAVDAGVVKLVGPNRATIVAAACQLMDDPQAYAAMAKGVSPYGDGRASARICSILRHGLGA